VQRDQREEQVEPGLVELAGAVGSVRADQPGQRPRVNPVLVLGNEAEADLHRHRKQQGENAERAERRMADADPLAAPIVADGGGAANEA
jgi:hypothetical protein